MWLAVNKDKSEIISEHELRRFVDKKYEMKRMDYACRFVDFQNPNPHWTPKLKSEDTPNLGKLIPIIELPKGTIEKLIGYKLTWEDEPVEYKETLYNLNMNLLTRKFPNFIFRDGCAEIIGYDPKNHIHMVIEDGNCCTTDNTWVVHQYKIKNPESFNWMEWKYICFDEIAEKILEERIEFN